MRGIAVGMTKATTIAIAMVVASLNAEIMFNPKGRKTPATIAMTIGMGMAAIIRDTKPVTPRKAINKPHAKQAPITSAKLRCCRAPPTSTAPGMVHMIAMG